MNLKIISKITINDGFPKELIESTLKTKPTIKNFSIEPFNEDIEYNFETEIDYTKIEFRAYITEILNQSGDPKVSEFELYINHDDALDIQKIETFIKDIVKSLPSKHQTMDFSYQYVNTQTI